MKYVQPYYLAYEDLRVDMINFLNQRNAKIHKAYREGRVGEGYVRLMNEYTLKFNRIISLLDEMFEQMPLHQNVEAEKWKYINQLNVHELLEVKKTCNTYSDIIKDQTQEIELYMSMISGLMD